MVAYKSVPTIAATGSNDGVLPIQFRPKAQARLGGPADARLRARELLEGSLTSLKALGLVEFRHQAGQKPKVGLGWVGGGCLKVTR